MLSLMRYPVGIAALLGFFYFFFWMKSPSLPSCDDSDTKRSMQNITKDIGYLTLINIQELEFNKSTGVRICSATLGTSKYGNEDIKYKIWWEDKSTFFSVFKSERKYFVQITE